MEQGKSQLKIGIVLNYVNMILGNLIPIFYTPIMLSLLGQSEYGLYKLSSSVTSYLSLISMGMGSAITRYLIKAREEDGKDAEEKMLGLFGVIFNVIALAALIIGSALTASLHLWYGTSLTQLELSRMRVLVLMMVVNMALNFSQAPYLSVVTAHENFLFYQSMNIIQTCIIPILNLAVLYAGAGSIGMTTIAMAMSVTTRIIYQVYVRRALQLRTHLKGLPVHRLKEILKFSFWIFVSNVVAQLYNTTDTVMIGMLPTLATTGVAVYNVGETFNSIMSSLTTGISNLLSPKVNRMVFQKASTMELSSLAIRVGRVQGYIMALIVSGFIAFGKPFISFYVGKEYLDSYWVAVLVMIPNMIPLVQSMCLSILVAENKHKFRSIVYLGMAILNVIGTWILMQYMGVIGAALMSGIALAVGNGVIMNWYYQRAIGLDIVRFWKETGKIFIIPTVMCSIILLVSKYVNFYNIITMIIGILMYTAAYCIANWFFVMNDYEKQLLTSPFQRIIGKMHTK